MYSPDMNDPVYAKISGGGRPTILAASGFMLLAAAGLWASSLLSALFPVGAKWGLALENLAYYLPFVALPIALYARRRPGLADAMRLRPLPGLTVLTLALLGLLSVYVASGLAALWQYGLDALGLPAVPSVPMPRTERELISMILSMAALPAVCEELLFRGFALAAWESRGTAFAVGVTAALFALLHGNLYGLPAYLLVGAVAGFVTVALDSVYAGIVYHTIYNTACLVIPYLLAGVDEAADAALTGPMLLSVALELVLPSVLLAMLLLTLRLRARNAGVVVVPRIRRPLSGAERAMLLAAVLLMLATNAAVLALSAHAAG